jgi:hypothetical protein
VGSGKSEREGKELGLGTEGGWAGSGPRGEKEEEERGRWAAGEKGPTQEGGGEESRPGWWFGLLSLLSFLYLFYFFS